MTKVSAPSRWRLLLQDGATAQEQMAIDAALAAQARPTFRLFRWGRPACSLGFRQPPPEWIDPLALGRAGIELVERPTGGGLAVHGSDVSCSAVMPRDGGCGPSELLAGLGDTVVRALDDLGVAARWVPDAPASGRMTHCLTELSPYAVMVGGRKIFGLALRRTPGCWLAQGSLLVHELPPPFEAVMPPAIRQAFRARAVALDEAAGASVTDDDVVSQLQRQWQHRWDSDAM